MLERCGGANACAVTIQSIARLTRCNITAGASSSADRHQRESLASPGASPRSYTSSARTSTSSSGTTSSWRCFALSASCAQPSCPLPPLCLLQDGFPNFSPPAPSSGTSGHLRCWGSSSRQRRGTGCGSTRRRVALHSSLARPVTHLSLGTANSGRLLSERSECPSLSQEDAAAAGRDQGAGASGQPAGAAGIGAPQPQPQPPRSRRRELAHWAVTGCAEQPAPPNPPPLAALCSPPRRSLTRARPRLPAQSRGWSWLCPTSCPPCS